MTRRSKSNPIKRMVQIIRPHAKHLCLSLKQSEYDAGIVLRDIRDGTEAFPPKFVAEALNEFGFNWGLLLLVYVRESNGKTKTVTEWRRFATHYKRADIDAYASEKRAELVDKAIGKGGELMDVGWIAMPFPPGDDDELIEQLLKLME